MAKAATIIQLTCPECQLAFSRQKGYQTTCCSQTCANRMKGRNKQVQINKVNAMRASAEANGKSWPTATADWSAKIAPFRKGARSQWSSEQVRLIDEAFDELVRSHVDEQVTLTELSKRHGFSHALLSKQFKRRGIKFKTHEWNSTTPERKLAEVIKWCDYHQHDREQLGGKELDFWFPQHKLAIEVNGLYWHSERSKSDRKYHLIKQQLCQSKGITLLQFWDNEIMTKTPIIESIVRHHTRATNTGVFARATKLTEVGNQEAYQFLNDNHIQGDTGASVRLGLTCQGQLVSLMTFSKSRFSKHEWEMTRFCSLINTSVVGGAAKLFKHFIKSYAPKSIVTYADLRLFSGGVYKQLGFNHSHDTTPAYWYANEDEYWPHHRMGFQRKHLARRLEAFNPQLTERENMEIHGWWRVWDCGQAVWIWTS